jgi:hypothetical protein
MDTSAHTTISPSQMIRHSQVGSPIPGGSSSAVSGAYAYA